MFYFWNGGIIFEMTEEWKKLLTSVFLDINKQMINNTFWVSVTLLHSYSTHESYEKLSIIFKRVMLYYRIGFTMNGFAKCLVIFVTYDTLYSRQILSIFPLSLVCLFLGK